ncbi:hypothetical protein [Zooshikella harenae]|uniref:Uncharacterized protein n=1 Tax=Zooshikella harenae TaxID=2827238 RepID=A0ABS5ZI48_9GAMM|nr:hypothetical protein [Zooshikella harenae]MBU2712935.1 hypothetical protein [Zooshikella harenae]
MKIKKVIATLDQWCCKYLQLNPAQTRLESIVYDGESLIVTSHEAFKRHIYHDKFCSTTVTSLNKSEVEKLGLAIGKSIADNLVVTFDKPVVRKSKK